MTLLNAYAKVTHFHSSLFFLFYSFFFSLFFILSYLIFLIYIFFFFIVFIILYFPLSSTEVTIFRTLSHLVRINSIKCARRKTFVSTNTVAGVFKRYSFGTEEASSKVQGLLSQLEDPPNKFLLEFLFDVLNLLEKITLPF